ncbi:MAG: hypothetical protein M0C28_31395 [Candidatus Moduliflexus flocculans]|nr:hypothetical protein [Candidatus Moduliflexus flocculans]
MTAISCGCERTRLQAKMTHISTSMLADIDSETVDFGQNFDGGLEEPMVLSRQTSYASFKWFKRYCCRNGNKYSAS